MPRHGCVPSLLFSDAQTAIDKVDDFDASNNWPASNAVEVLASIRELEERHPATLGGLT